MEKTRLKVEHDVLVYKRKVETLEKLKELEERLSNVLGSYIENGKEGAMLVVWIHWKAQLKIKHTKALLKRLLR